MGFFLVAEELKVGRFKKGLLFLFLCIFFLFPTSFGAGFKFLAIFFFCLVGVCFLVVHGGLSFRRVSLAYALFAIASLVSIVVSGLHGLAVSGSSLVHWASLFRVFYFLLISLFFLALFYGEGRGLYSFLAGALILFLSVQLCFLVLQALGFSSWLSVVYAQEKMRGLDSYMRGTGSFGNPNTVAILSVLSMTIIWFFGGDKKKKIIAVALVGACVLLSGSRTGSFIYLVSLILCVLYEELHVYWKFLVGSVGVLLAVFLWSFVGLLEEYFPYLWQAVKSSSDVSLLLEIDSISARLENWSWKVSYFNSVNAPAKAVFGVGFVESYKVLDNEYLFLYLRTGLLGALTFSCFLFFPFLYSRYVLRVRGEGSKLFFVMLFLGLLWSFLFEFFSDFIMPVLFYMIASSFSCKAIFTDGAARR